MEMEIEENFSLHKMKEIKNKENKIVVRGGGGWGNKERKLRRTSRDGSWSRLFDELICTAKEE